MKKLKVYLDTSIINFLYITDSPEYQKATEVFFKNVISKGIVEAYVSNIVIDEINQTKDNEYKNKLLKTFDNFKNIRTLVAENNMMKEIASLSENYIKNGIIPSTKVADSFHIAYSTLFQMDILLSWNFKHLANISKEQKIITLNRTLGYYYPFRMANPLEVYFEE